MEYKILNNTDILMIKSNNFNHFFNKKNGFSAVWGKEEKDNPEYSPIGCLIVDIELSKVCSQGCSFCYKGNTSRGDNMSLETFKVVLSKLPKTVGQIAFGIGDIDGNPELFEILTHCREQGVVPNITINGFRMSTDYCDRLASVCGAIAVSNYEKDICYGAVKDLTDRIGKYGNTLKTVNIHAFSSLETKENLWEVIKDTKTDTRLSGLGSVVFLSLKPKSRAKKGYSMLPYQELKEIIKYCLDNNVGIGFDSCGCNRFIHVIKELDLGVEKTKEFIDMSESCESSLFSFYIDCYGMGYPCSFSEGGGAWSKGLDVKNCKDFLKDIWFSDKLNKYREKSIKSKDCNGCRTCLIYPEISKVGG